MSVQNTVDHYLIKLLEYKQEKLRQLGLEFLPPPEMSEIGGMDLLKIAIDRVADEFSPEARRDNIPVPKGWLLAGVPGSGKSWAAKVMAQKLRLPMIYISIDSVRSKGASYLSWILKRVEAAAPNLIYFDEFDKLFPKTQDSTTTEILGVLLTWLQEKKAHSFALATLNRLDALPPEMTRAGRFDAVWYVGFPQPKERLEIFKLHLKYYDHRYKENYDLSMEKWVELLMHTINFTGAEISNIVQNAAREKYQEKKNKQRQIESKIKEIQQEIASWIEYEYYKQKEYDYLTNVENLLKDVASNPEIQVKKEYEDLAGLVEEIKTLKQESEQIKMQKLEIDYETLLHFTKSEISVYKRAGESVIAIENRAKDVCIPVSSKDESNLIPNDGTFWPEVPKKPLRRKEIDIEVNSHELSEVQYVEEQYSWAF